MRSIPIRRPRIRRVGKGVGTAFQQARDSRARAHHGRRYKDAPSMVGTAHDRLWDLALLCQRLCPPYDLLLKAPEQHAHQLVGCRKLLTSSSSSNFSATSFVAARSIAAVRSLGFG